MTEYTKKKTKNKNLLLNEGYYGNNQLYDKGIGTYIYSGNKKYLDLCCGSGSMILGYNHKIFRDSLKSFSKLHIANFGSPNKYAVNFITKIKKVLPQFEKFIFCNSGAEANIKALRIARAVTNKKFIVMVTGSWHGSADQLLFKINNNKKVSMSGGLDNNLKKNLLFIPYNEFEKSKRILDKNINNIACIIMEPIQGALPDENSINYLSKLNNYCKKNKLILIFDEIISGLRFKNGSLQNLLNLKSDVSTFGKSFGAGMPIGFIGISEKIAKALKKKDKKIIFGGTFSGNSLTSHMGTEFLKYYIKNKDKLINDINSKTCFFCEEMNTFFDKNNINIKAYYFQSLARIVFSNDQIINRTQRDFLEKNKFKKITKMSQELNKLGIKYPSNGLLLFNSAMSYKDINFMIFSFQKVIKRIF